MTRSILKGTVSRDFNPFHLFSLYLAPIFKYDSVSQRYSIQIESLNIHVWLYLLYTYTIILLLYVWLTLHCRSNIFLPKIINFFNLATRGHDKKALTPWWQWRWELDSAMSLTPQSWKGYFSYMELLRNIFKTLSLFIKMSFNHGKV